VTEPSPKVAHSARLLNHLLGGTENHPVDRAAAEQMLRHLPGLATWARCNRRFLGRAVRYLTGTAGIAQFLDVGAGLPTADNTHQVAPDATVLYADNDPQVVAHGRRLLTGNATYIEADLRDPDHILRAAAATLDFSEPVALMLIGVVDFIVDDNAATTAVRDLMAGLPAGSYLVLSHPTLEVAPEAVVRAMEWWNASGSVPICARTPIEIAGFFRGLDLLDPGVVTVTRWRPDGNDTTSVPEYAGMARKA
jgi:O-methyltransferase involved in polyketide biosynthesis